MSSTKHAFFTRIAFCFWFGLFPLASFQLNAAELQAWDGYQWRTVQLSAPTTQQWATSGSNQYGGGTLPGGSKALVKQNSSVVRIPGTQTNYTKLTRSAATNLALGKFAVGAIKSLPLVATVASLVSLATDLKGIWKKDPSGENYLEVDSLENSCAPVTMQNVCKAFTGWPDARGGGTFLRYEGNSCLWKYTCYSDLYGGPSYVQLASPLLSTPTKRRVTDDNLSDELANSPRFPEIIKELDNNPDLAKFPWPSSIEVPTPPVKLPLETTNNPDGSTTKKDCSMVQNQDLIWQKQCTQTQTQPSTPGSTVTSPVTATTTSTETPPPEQQTDCEKYPDIIGCSKYGDPQQQQLPKDTKDVSFLPVPFQSSATCPQPITFVSLGRTYAFEWAPMCNALTAYARPVILILSAAMASMLFIGGLKS